MSKDFRTSDGKRTQSTKEWLNRQGDDPVVKCILYSTKEDHILEYWKNKRNLKRILTSSRKPTDAERKHYGEMLTEKKWRMGKLDLEQIEIMIKGDIKKKVKIELQTR